MKVFYPLVVLSLSFLINGFFLDIGFRMIPLYFFCFPMLFILCMTKDFRLHKLNFFEIALLVFYIFAVFSSLYTISHELSFRFMMGLTIVIVCYVTLKSMAYDFPNYMAVLRWSFRIFVSASLIYYLAGLSVINLGAEHTDFFGATVEKGIPRMIGLNNDPNICASAILFPLLFFCFDKSVFSRTFFFFSLFCLLATLSRGGMLAGVVGLFAAFFMVNSRVKLYYLGAGTLLGFVVIGVYSFFSDTLSILFEKRINGMSSGGGRFEVWNNALTLFDSNPHLGFGIFTFRHVSELNYDIPKFAHNTYLEVLVETGWIGFLLFLIFCFLIIINSFFVAVKSEEYQYLFPLTCAILFSMMSLSMYINPIFIFMVLLNSISLNNILRKKSAA